MSFHLGRPILVLALVALVTGSAIFLRPPPRVRPLVLWTFVDSHAQSYRRQVDESVDVQLVNVSAENIRLSAMFNRPSLDPNQPDVVEIEIGSVGRYFRAPLDDVPFLPLNDFLDRDDWRNRIVESRLSPWSKNGTVFGFPHDVHPVSICYRRDLFEQAGVDLSRAKTWREFQSACLQFQNYWREHGEPRRRTLELPTSAADALVMMLLQRHINLLDDRDQVHLTDPRVADTIAFYARLVAGDRAIGEESTPGANLWVRDFVSGNICALITPDWRAGFLKRFGDDASGKVAMMPLPIFEPGDAPTATWGGTMAAIPRRTRDPEKAWRLITRLYSDRSTVEDNFRQTMILPAIKDLWTAPAFHQGDPYFAQQLVGELYIDLAGKIPPHYWSTFTPLANARLVAVLSRAIELVDAAASEETLRAAITRALADESKELQTRIDFGKFE